MKTQHAIKSVGSIKKLAEFYGITTTAIYAWKGEVPELRALQLEKHLMEKRKKSARAKK